MKDRQNIFEFNDITFDAMHRFLVSKNTISKIANLFLNVLWYFGKLIKKILGKDKIENPVIDKNINDKKDAINNLTLKDFFDFEDYINKQNNDNILFIDLKKESDDVSGAIDFGNYEIEQLSKSSNVFVLNYTRNVGNWYLSINRKSYEIPLYSFIDIERLFKKCHISKIVINNLAYYPAPEEMIDIICDIKEKHSTKMEMHFNDYLAICPSFFLLNKNGKPCGNPSENDCKECLYNSPYRTLIRNDIDLWRNSFRKLFMHIDVFYFYSEYTQNLFLSVYPEIEGRCNLTTHEVMFSNNMTKYIRPKKDKKIRIGYVGMFTPLKGSYYFADVINMLIKDGYDVEPVIIGKIDEPNVDYKTTGKYDRDNLGKLLSVNKINMVIFASANNETFSYVAQELMELKVPFTLFACGAPKERIIKEKYSDAVIADEPTSESMYEATIKLLKKLELI